MKTIFRIAGTELRTMFYSPIAWFVLVVFLIQSGITYFNIVEGTAIQQEMGGIRLRYIVNLMSRVFSGNSGIFKSIMQNLYLYIPLLTMGLISRETSSGTIKLLFSSPIKVKNIIYGKFLAMVVYSLLMVGIVSIFVLLGFTQVKDAEGGMLMTSLLGFFLLLCTYSAIGLFMSCLTTYQIVAAVCTFVMIGLLTYIGSVWQGIEFIRDITYYLSLSGRAENMLNGFTTTKDVVYFLVIIFIFLGLSINKLRSATESKPAFVRFGRSVAVVVIGITIGYISSLPSLTGYNDATVNKRHTIGLNIQKIVSDLGDEPLEVVTYNNVLGGFGMLGRPETYNTLRKTWERYNRFKKGHNITVRKVTNYYDSTLDNRMMLMGYENKSLKEIAEQITKASDVSMRGVKSPEEIRKIIDLRPELNRFVMQLNYKGRSTFLRIFDDQQFWPSDTEIAAAFKRLLDAELPKVAFVTGDLERNIFRSGDREFAKLGTAKNFRYSLINQGFDSDTISLEHRDVPKDVSILVLADPKLELTSPALARLKEYIRKGGNVVFNCEPGRNTIWQPILSQLGLKLMEGKVIQADRDMAPERIELDFTNTTADWSKYLADMKKDSLGDRVRMKTAAGIVQVADSGFVTEPLLMSKENVSWNRVKELDLDLITTALAEPMQYGTVYGEAAPETTDTASRSASKDSAQSTAKLPRQALSRDNGGAAPIDVTAASLPRNNRMDGTVSFSPQDGDTRGPITTAIALHRKVEGKEQRIVVTGDADFLSNSANGDANFFFTTAVFNWLTYGEFPVDSYRKPTTDNRVLVTTAKLDYLKIIYLWVLPAAMIAFATVLLLRRKRK